MQGQFIALAEKRVHARPATEHEARLALEWIAAREGKTLKQVVDEIATRGTS
jgi:hypothetical protein